jgi:hypothetical protein
MTTPDPDRLLAGYLRDHHAGAVAGLALAERCRDANVGTSLGATMTAVADEIAEDKGALEAIMDQLGVGENAAKAVAARAAELIGRLKSNGTFTRYSPASRVVELEALLAGIDAKRNLWRALRTADADQRLDRDVLDNLVARATSQRHRLLAEHDDASKVAFADA